MEYDDIRDGHAQPAIQIFATGQRDQRALGRILTRSSIPFETVADFDGFLQRIRAGCGPVVTTTGAVGRRVKALRETLDVQPEWSDVPIILVTRQGRTPAARLEALLERGNVTLLRRPVQATTLVTVVRSALADRRRQYGVRGLLDDLQRLNERNRRRIEQLRRLTCEISRVEERERRRLASLLHDDLQQLLVGAQYRLNVIERRARSDRSIDTALDELREQLVQAIERSRSLSHELSPPPLRRQTLASALRWLAERTQAAYGLEVEVRGELDQKLQPEDLEILAFRSVQELLFNVVKHADTGRARVTLGCQDGYLTIEVRDEGKGFDPAAEGAQRDAPAGFGLFSIRERAQVLGGEFVIASESGRGCTCTLRLPLGAVGDADGDAIATGGDGSGRLRVLIVDDHRYLREGVKALLAEEVDLEVVGEAEDGREALDEVRRRHPDVVLLDVAMPVMDGLETARRLRSHHPGLRIVGLSTFGHDDMGERMRAAGADTYVCKSDPGEQLVAAVRGGRGS
jgi:signal transduction histidine kinase/CheY-like chemotaxis protein